MAPWKNIEKYMKQVEKKIGNTMKKNWEKVEKNGEKLKKLEEIKENWIMTKHDKQTDATSA